MSICGVNNDRNFKYPERTGTAPAVGAHANLHGTLEHIQIIGVCFLTPLNWWTYILRRTYRLIRWPEDIRISAVKAKLLAVHFIELWLGHHVCPTSVTPNREQQLESDTFCFHYQYAGHGGDPPDRFRNGIERLTRTFPLSTQSHPQVSREPRSAWNVAGTSAFY